MKDKNNVPRLPDKVDKHDTLDFVLTTFDPISVKEKALLEMEGKKSGDSFKSEDIYIVPAMTLKEFHHGLLMAWGLKDTYQSFAVQLSRDYQTQYKCETVGRKSLAELAALNYCRILEIQRRINNVLENDVVRDEGTRYIATMSKELDRAQRHYLTAMQALEIGLQPPINLSVRTQVANIANQQVVQEQILKDRKEYGI